MIYGLKIIDVSNNLTYTPLGEVSGNLLYCTGQSDVTFGGDSFYSGFIASIGDYKDKINIEEGGEFAFEGEFIFKLKSYGETQNFYQELKDNDINLLGRKVQLIDLTRSLSDSIQHVMTTKRIDRISQTDGELKITCRGLWHGEDQPFPPNRLHITEDMEETEDTGKVIPRVYGSVRYCQALKVSSSDYQLKTTKILGYEYVPDTDLTRIYVTDYLDQQFFLDINNLGGLVKINRDDIVKDVPFAYYNFFRLPGDKSAWAEKYIGFKITLGVPFADGAFLVADHEINYISYSSVVDDPLITWRSEDDRIHTDDPSHVDAFSETINNPFNSAYFSYGPQDLDQFYPVQDAEVSIVDDFPIYRYQDPGTGQYQYNIKYSGAFALIKMNNTNRRIQNTGVDTGQTRLNIKNLEVNPFNLDNSEYLARTNIYDPANELDAVNFDGCFLINATIPKEFFNASDYPYREICIGISCKLKNGRCYMTTALDYPSTIDVPPIDKLPGDLQNPGRWTGTIWDKDEDSIIEPVILHTLEGGSSIFSDDKVNFEPITEKYRPDNTFAGSPNTILRENTQYLDVTEDSTEDRYLVKHFDKIGDNSTPIGGFLTHIREGEPIETLSKYDLENEKKILIATQAEIIYSVFLFTREI